MTTTSSNTPRLLAAAKEFNIGKETLVEFLADKGFEISSNPSTKLSEQMYSALQVEFAQDKKDKQKSAGIALPKGSLLEGIKKTKEELDITVKDRKEDHPVKAPEAKAKPVEEKPKEKPVEAKQPEAPKKVEVTPPVIVEVPAPVPAPEPVKVEPAPVPKPIQAEEKTETIAPAAEEAPAKKVAAKKVVDTPAVEKEAAAEPETPECEGTKKLAGPNIVGKIDLDQLNLESRPKKGAVVAKKKEPVKEPAKKETKTKAAKSETEEVIPVAEVPAPVVAAEVVPPAPPAEEKIGTC
jgi:translation initiation factor IF-2